MDEACTDRSGRSPRVMAPERFRRGQDLLHRARLHPIEGEAAIELPFGFEPSRPSKIGPIAVILHAFHLDLIDEIRLYLDNIPYPADIFVSTDTDRKRDLVTASFANWPRGAVEVVLFPNRGRDIAPKLVGFDAVHRAYEYVLHVHTKRSAHETRLVGWRGYILETLLGSARTVHDVFTMFARAPGLGLLAPQHIDELRPWIRWAGNFSEAAALGSAMGIALPPWTPIDFPSGSMFWARTAALRPLLDLGLRFEDFPEESGQTDATLAHAIERLYFLACERAGFDWLKITVRGELHDQDDVTRVASSEELRRFLRSAPIRLTPRLREGSPEEQDRVVVLPPAKPRRVMHARWRQLLGDDASMPAPVRVVAALFGPAALSDALAVDVATAIGRLRIGTGTLRRDPEATRVEVLAAAFAEGTDLVVMIDRPGHLHAGALEAFARMAAAHDGRVLMEGAVAPAPDGKLVDPDRFEVPSIAGPIIAVTRVLVESVCGLGGGAIGTATDRELSALAHAARVPLRRCPRALFHPATSEGSPRDVTEGIDIALRLDDMADLPLACASLFPMAGQLRPRGVSDATATTPRLHVHLLTERLDVADLRRARDALSGDREGTIETVLSLENWDYRYPFGLRIPLLNRALQRGTGRYFCVLEAGDQLVPGALAMLLDRLDETGTALSLAGRWDQMTRWWGDVMLPLRPAAPRVSPKESSFFLLDRTRVLEAPVFQVADDNDEIADFVRRVRARQPVDDALSSKPLCVRPIFGTLPVPLP